MASELYRVDWTKHFDVPFTDHMHVELGQQTIEFLGEGREPGDGLNSFEFEGYHKQRGDHPGFFFNCNNDRKRWFFNIFDKRHRNEIES